MMKCGYFVKIEEEQTKENWRKVVLIFSISLNEVNSYSGGFSQEHSFGESFKAVSGYHRVTDSAPNAKFLNHEIARCKTLYARILKVVRSHILFLSLSSTFYYFSLSSFSLFDSILLLVFYFLLFYNHICLVYRILFL